MQDLGGWQDDHAEKDVEESQRGSGQDAPARRCPLEKELLGRSPHGTAAEKKATVSYDAAHGGEIKCRITTLELPRCAMHGQDAQRLAGVLTNSLWGE